MHCNPPFALVMLYYLKVFIIILFLKIVLVFTLKLFLMFNFKWVPCLKKSSRLFLYPNLESVSKYRLYNLICSHFNLFTAILITYTLRFISVSLLFLLAFTNREGLKFTLFANLYHLCSQKIQDFLVRDKGDYYS